MIGGFSFDHGGRSYVCTVEERKTPPVGKWWWFAVTGDQQRYAPFETASNDTQGSVKSRVVKYYENLLVVRARPVEPRQHWAGRGRPAAKPAAPADAD